MKKKVQPPLPDPKRRLFLQCASLSVAGLAAGCRRVAAVLDQGVPRIPGTPEYLGDFKINTVDRPVPAFDEADWRLVVDGLVGKPRTFDWRAFSRLPRTRMTEDFVCVEAWSVPDVAYCMCCQ